MSAPVESLPGVSDLLPENLGEWHFLEATAHRVFPQYGYGEIRTPIFERTEIFQRAIGEQTDIVQKEMYTFADRGGRSLTLRPEGTAGVLRALVDAGITPEEERRVYYLGPMFRGERPAAGRKRQFHQVGCECVGPSAPAIDVECIALLMRFLESLEINAATLALNSRGTAEDRPAITRAFSDYFSGCVPRLCADCQRRLHSNVWRILDCKVEGCREAIAGAPSVIDLLGAGSRHYFDRVCALLTSLGITYTIEPRLVRGLDYYEHTVFEVTCAEGLGAQNALAGGGRYQLQLPGEKHPISGVGFAAGSERLLLVRQPPKDGDTTSPVTVEVYLIGLGEPALNANLSLAEQLRRRGIRTLLDLEGRGMKAQMRQANKFRARFAVIRGDRELASGIVACKRLATGEQTELPLVELVNYLETQLRSLTPT